MTTVFVSYRREDTAGEARALFNELSTKLGKESVFMDVDNIALGRDFRHVLQEHLAACDLLLVIVGRGWVEAKDASGRNRLEQPNDFVRLEIESALKRNIPVTPVLVQGAQMPTVDQLPVDVRDFAYRNGFELSHARWESDVAEMCKRLGLGKHAMGTTRMVDTSGGESPADGRVTQANVAPIEASTAHKRNRNPWLATIAAMVMAIAAAGAGLLYYRTLVDQEAEIEQARVEAAKARADAENKIAALKAEADRARADAEAKALADAKAVKDAADRAEKERAAEAAARVEKERAAARAEKERAAAAAAQAEKERIAADQAKKDRLAAEERDRALKQPNPTPPQTRPTDDAASLLRKAKALAKGEGVPRDFEESKKLYFQAAVMGNAEAQAYVGRLYEYGRGVPKDEVEALKWFRKAAAQGDRDGQFALGLAFEQGRGVSIDSAEAAKWYGKAAYSFQKAAEAGEANAQYFLGNMYQTGRGVTKNYTEAVKWFRRAAEQGHTGGQYFLAGMYEKGIGVREDKGEAVNWYRKAARQGHPLAQKALQRLNLSW